MQFIKFIKLICVFFALSHLFAAAPAWWSERGLVPQNSNQASDDTINNNYAVANLGQLKFFARTAADEMNAKLSGGAGAEINNLIASFGVYDANNPNENYKIINLGQLKAVAKLFYDRLNQASSSVVTYPVGMNLISGGTSAATHKYPWPAMPAAPTEDDYKKNYASANIGQLKFLFAWSISVPSSDE